MKAQFVSANFKQTTPYCFYDMSNALDIKQTILPVLRKRGIKFEYDSYANFLTVRPLDSSEAALAKNIILEIGKGVVTTEPLTDDGAVIIMNINLK